MFKKYFVTGFRKTLRDKLFFILNVAGLSVGMAACIIILSYVKFENSYDQFHENVDQLYRITSGKYTGEKGYVPKKADTYYGVGEVLSSKIPEIEKYVTLTQTNTVFSTSEKSAWQDKAYFTTNQFFNIFSYNLIKGDPATVLENPNAVVLSEQLARFYFGDADPVGKVLKYGGNLPLEVTGVFENTPENSHLNVDLLVNIELLHRTTRNFYRDSPWSYVYFFTYIRAQRGFDAKQLEQKIQSEHKNIIVDRAKVKKNAGIGIQKVANIHLHSDLEGEARVNGNQRALSFLSIIAVFIIAIAWINYVNFASAKSTERGKEVGIRKVFGSSKKQLRVQFLLESFFFNALAFFVALTLAQLALPFFSNLTGNPLTLAFGIDTWLLFVGILISGIVLSGLYPAIILTSFKPIEVLKGQFYATKRGAWMQKGLISLQLVAAVILIAGSLTIIKQLHFMRNHDLGFDKQHKLVIKGPGVMRRDTRAQMKSFKNEVNNLHYVNHTSGSAYVPGEEAWLTWVFKRVDSQAEKGQDLNVNQITGEYLKLFDLTLIAGRGFKKLSSSSDHDNEAIINEKAALRLGFESPEYAVGEKLVNQNKDTVTIVGVLENFHQQSLEQTIEPIIFLDKAFSFNYFVMDFQSNNIQKDIAELKKMYVNFFPGNPFDYFFVDQFFDAQYKSDVRFSKVFSIFTGLAIFIACLGLFGLTVLLVQHRTKEISIRKVVGASVMSIYKTISTDFLKLNLISLGIGLPLAYYIFSKWLENYAYRISPGGWFIVIPVVAIVLVSLVSISFKVIKAANINPAESLKDE